MASSRGGASGEVVDKGDGREVERWTVLECRHRGRGCGQR